MSYGLYISAAGTLTSLHRQDVLANNLANLGTVGFKPDQVAAVSRLPERWESLDPSIDPQVLLEQLGGGQFAGPTRVSLRQGVLTETGNDLDLAIQGNGFFTIESRSGPGGGARSRQADGTRFTRDGRFTLNSAGELVMASTGLRVLDVNGRPVRLDRTAKVEIDADGGIVQNGAVVAKLQIAEPVDASRLVKEGANLLKIEPAARGSQAATRRPASGAVVQGSIESSAVDPIMALNDMINVSKAVAANATMMQYHDNLLGQAVNTFGRVA